jgi:DNA repair protein SbcD/Mre11
MRILHTSDWHLGRTLHGRQRHDEFAAFLDWLAATLDDERIDVLIVAGDIFDTSTPGTRAQNLYYRFLWKAAQSHCRHVVVVAGNHDSPSFLDAPRALLRALDVHVIGAPPADIRDEVRLLGDADGTPALIVCAVPYLRDRDLRSVEAGETTDDKERKLLEGLRAHYATVLDAAREARIACGMPLPIVVTGHLFTAGGRTVEGDGVRDLSIGSLSHAPSDVFGGEAAYVALGHLHVPQDVTGATTIRYSGSPIAMGFGEVGQEKSVCIVELGEEGVAEVQHGIDVAEMQHACSVRRIGVPCFRRMARVRGSWQEIVEQLDALAASDEPVLLEVVHDGAEALGDLRDSVLERVAGTQLEVLRTQDVPAMRALQLHGGDGETLDALDELTVFARLLAERGVDEAQRTELTATYREALAALHDIDEGEE